MPREVFGTTDLDATDKKQLSGLRSTVSGLAKQYGLFKDKAATIGPKVMKFYDYLVGKHGSQKIGGFIGFCRLFDANIPDKAADYRKNKTYYTLNHMRVAAQNARRVVGRQGQRDPARDQLARMVATILQFVRDADPVYEAVRREFNMQKRGIAQLKTRVENAEPLLKGAGRPVVIDASHIVHMEPRAKTTETTTEAVNVPAAARRAMGQASRRRAS